MKKAVELDPDEMRAEREDGEGGVLDFAGMMGVDIKQEKRPDGTQDTKVRIGEGKERELNMDVGLKGFFKDFVDDETEKRKEGGLGKRLADFWLKVKVVCGFE